MERNTLSIIIPVYNSEKYLGQCIDSVLQQTYSEFQLILIDDASTDNSGEICDRYALKDKRIKVVHHEKNKGLSLSREEGFLMVDTEWISFIDNDDYICPVMYENLLSYADEGDIICIRGEDKSCKEIENIKWNEDGREIFRFTGEEAGNVIYTKAMDLGCIGPIWGKIIKRSLLDSVYEKVKPYKEKLYWVFFEDVLFTPFMFYYANSVVIDNRLMYLHRHFKDNLSSTLIPKEYHYEAVEAGDIVLHFLREHNRFEAYNKYLQGYLLLVSSTGYKVWRNEQDEEKKKKFEIKVNEIFDIYYSDIKNNKCRCYFDWLSSCMFTLFKKNKTLWCKTIGNIYFVIARNILY